MQREATEMIGPFGMNNEANLMQFPTYRYACDRKFSFWIEHDVILVH